MTKELHHRTKHAVIAASLTAVLGAVPMTAYACSDTAYLGSVCITAATFCPAGYLEANGQVIQRNSNPALSALLGDYYGGDGVNTFALPDLRGRFPVHIGIGPGLTPVALGKASGSETVTLNAANLPRHSHEATYNPAGGSAKLEVTVPVSSKNTGNTPAPDSTHKYLAASPTTGGFSAAIWADQMAGSAAVAGVTGTISGGAGTVTVEPAGANSPVAVIPPRLGLRFCIAADNFTFPSKN